MAIPVSKTGNAIDDAKAYTVAQKKIITDMRGKHRLASAVEQEAAEAQKAADDYSDAELLALYNDDPNKVFATNDNTITPTSAPPREEEPSNNPPNDGDDGEDIRSLHQHRTMIPRVKPSMKPATTNLLIQIEQATPPA